MCVWRSVHSVVIWSRNKMAATICIVFVKGLSVGTACKITRTMTITFAEIMPRVCRLVLWRYFYWLTSSTWALVLPCKIVFVSSTFLTFQRLFHELLNRHQACLYLFECIFHGGFKWAWNVDIFDKCVIFLTCHLLTPAVWNGMC